MDDISRDERLALAARAHVARNRVDRAAALVARLECAKDAADVELREAAGEAVSALQELVAVKPAFGDARSCSDPAARRSR